MAKKPPWWAQTNRAQRYIRIGRQFAHEELDSLADVKFPRAHNYPAPYPLRAWATVAEGVHIKSEALMEYR